MKVVHNPPAVQKMNKDAVIDETGPGILVDKKSKGKSKANSVSSKTDLQKEKGDDSKITTEKGIAVVATVAKPKVTYHPELDISSDEEEKDVEKDRDLSISCLELAEKIHSFYDMSKM